MATKVEELRQVASQKWDAFAAEMGKYNDDNLPTPEQAAEIDRLRGEATSAQKELAQAAEFAKAKTDFETKDKEIRGSRNSRPPAAAAEGLRQARPSLGDQLVKSDNYKSMLAEMPASKRLPDKFHANMLNFGSMKGLLEQHAELLVEGEQSSAGALIVPDRYGPVTEFGRRPLVIRNVITNLTTSSDMVEFVRITDEDSKAAVVPEAQSTDPEYGDSGIKPESDMKLERIPVPVVTIAHWMAATTRALSDANQLRGLIDSFLRFGVDQELENQIVNGGGGDEFDGILNTDGRQQQSFTLDVFKTTRQARRKVRTVGRRVPTAYLLNPIDWEEIQLQKDANERYYGNGPFGMGPEQLWGLPVIETEAIAEGTGLVGDFSTCVLWDREESSISVSNSHADFFIRNLVAILCELRAAFGVLKPNALVEIDLGGLS